MIVTEEAKPEETTTAEETPSTEAVAAETTSDRAVEEQAHDAEATTPAHKEHKDNVIDTIKKGPLGKFFKKKEPNTAEHAKEETTEAAVPETTEAAAVTEEAPVAETNEPVAAAGKFSNKKKRTTAVIMICT